MIAAYPFFRLSHPLEARATRLIEVGLCNLASTDVKRTQYQAGEEYPMEGRSKLETMTPEERRELILRLHTAQNSLCYICKKIIDLQVHRADVDHIIARARGGNDDESNWAVAHHTCNRSKGARDLLLQRHIFRYKEHVEKYGSTAAGAYRNFTLSDALQELAPKRQDAGMVLKQGIVQLSYVEDGQPRTFEYPLLVDGAVPGVRSFVGMIPFACIHHDPDINPRSIVDLEPMIEEFYNGNPQLQPSLATLSFSEPQGRAKAMLFDGQHKAAAQLYLSRSQLFVRVFINPDRERLKQTNYRAHTKLAQIHFPQLVNDRVGADLFIDEFNRYMAQADLTRKSERTFFEEALDHQQRSEFRGYFQSYLRFEILTGKVDGDSNNLLDYVETIVARSKRYPLSYETTQRSFLNDLVFLKPAKEPLEVTERFRHLERDNLIRLMNIFVEEVLTNGRFDLGRGIYRIEESLRNDPDSIPDSHLRAYRICRLAPMVIWCEELTRAIRTLLNVRLRYEKGSWSEDRPLWAEMKSEDWNSIRKMIRAIRDHKVWGERTNAQMLTAMSSTKQRDWQEILINGKLPGREGQLLPKLDQNFVFQAAQ